MKGKIQASSSIFITLMIVRTNVKYRLSHVRICKTESVYLIIGDYHMLRDSHRVIFGKLRVMFGRPRVIFGSLCVVSGIRRQAAGYFGMSFSRRKTAIWLQFFLYSFLCLWSS